MNKKVNKYYKDIKDVYVLQCNCTELNDLLQKKDKEIERLNYIINELDKILEEDVILRCCHNGRMQYNKTLTEGGLLFREYIKSTLQDLKGRVKF